MRSVVGLACLVIVAALSSCRLGPRANARLDFDLMGLCESCPPVRLDTLLRDVEGVATHEIDVHKKLVHIAYDSVIIRQGGLISLLNDAGYDVGDNLAILPAVVDTCCFSPEEKTAMGFGLKPNPTYDDGATEADEYTDELYRMDEDDFNYIVFGDSLRSFSGANLDAMLDAELAGVLKEDLLGRNYAKDPLQEAEEADAEDVLEGSTNRPEEY